MQKYFILIFGILLFSNLVFAFNFPSSEVVVSGGGTTIVYNATLSNFIDLEDTPASYAGESGSCIRVNSTEDGLEFFVCPAGGGAVDEVTGTGYIIVNPTTGDVVVTLNETFLNQTIDARATGLGDNSSWNESYADTLYYSITNPLNFINSTDLADYNDTVLILSVNTSLWNYITTNEASWLSTYNETYNTWAYNQTTPANTYTDSVNASTASWIDLTFLKIANFFTKKGDGIYLTNDTDTIYFNETQLNITIDARASGGGGGSSLWETNGTSIYNSTVSQVGIGTATPSAKMEVNGSVRFFDNEINVFTEKGVLVIEG